MEHITALTQQAEAFLMGPDFFYYHGVVLTLLWFVVCNIGILMRKVSLILHALIFFLVDVTTVLFSVGALCRVYPYLDRFTSWSPIKQGHIVGGAIFLILVILQHVGGVITLLKNQENPGHRKFAVLITNLGRLLAIFGMILGEYDQNIIIGSSIFAVLLLVVSVYKGFIAPDQKSLEKPSQKVSARFANRQKSPKRD